MFLEVKGTSSLNVVLRVFYNLRHGKIGLVEAICEVILREM